MKKERFQQSTLDCLGKFISENITIKIEIRNPTAEEKNELMAQTGKDGSQISQWFARQKRKLSSEKVKAWCMHEIGLAGQGMPPPTTVSNSTLVGKKRRKTTNSSHNSKRVAHGATSEDSPFDHLQLRVLRNARANNLGASAQALKVITTCARLSEKQLQNWWNKFPTTKLSPELRQQQEQDLVRRTMPILSSSSLDTPESQRLIWLLQQSFIAIGSDPSRLNKMIQFHLQAQSPTRQGYTYSHYQNGHRM